LQPENTTKSVSNSACENCGLPDAKLRAKIHRKDGTAWRPDSTRTLLFCGEQCARQFAFLQLETRSTSDKIARYLGKKQIRFSQFVRIVPLALVDPPLKPHCVPVERSEFLQSGVGPEKTSARPGRRFVE
jgi:hypothetical protein